MNAVAKVKETRMLSLNKARESKKVSSDGGFTAIPNELLFAMGKFGFTQRQFNLLIAVIQKTLSWHKEMDWISNSQICELVDLPDEQKASKTKQELVRMNVLIQKGNQIGLNLAVTDWKKTDCTKGANIAQKMQKKLHKSCNSDCTKGANTKETTTKEKINNPPIVPQGETDQTVPLEEKPKSEPVDYQGVMDAWNESFAETPIGKLRVLNDHRKRQIHRLAKNLRSQFGSYTPKAFRDYFNDFWQQISAKPNSFYLGNNNRKWVADFDYVMLPKTFAKTVEETL